MAQKRDVIFDSLYGGSIDPEDTKLDNETEDVLEPQGDNIEQDELAKVKLKDNKELKKENNLEINGKSYHIEF